MNELSIDELMFFEQSRDALPLYEHLRDRILREIDAVEIQVKKTQISFRNRRLFAAASFARVRKAKKCPKPYMTITFGLAYRLNSPRIDIAVEAYPNRWTHHAMVGSTAEIDDELLSWIKAAADFSDAKR